MNTLLLTSEIRTEADVVFVRQRARQLAELLGFSAQDQTRIATAVSELARNAFQYALGGRTQFFVEGEAPQRFVIRVSDRGQGIGNLAVILDGHYTSKTGMGMGLLGARGLMDTFRVDTVPGRGTIVELGKLLPGQAPIVDIVAVSRIMGALTRVAPISPLEETRQQNADLLRAFDDLRARQLELDRMYREVADANRRLADVNAQLEDKAVVLARTAAAEQTARAEAEAAVTTRDSLLAVVSHDLRNPLSAIMMGATLLQSAEIGGADKEMVAKWGRNIHRSAERMNRLISDLLDIAQIQAGRLAVVPTRQDVDAIIREALEMLRPLATRLELWLDGVAPPDLAVCCDRERVLQILSNLVGNALKFTAKGGSISLTAREEGSDACFAVRDTGSGIAEAELPWIFDRFWQARRNLRGSIGLGLSIAKGLVEAHGGRLWVESQVGIGTTFFFTLPRVVG